MMAPKKEVGRKAPSNPVKNGLIGKIHVAKGQLGLDDDTYRDLLVRVTGKDSSRKCSISDLEAVVAEFERLSWRPKKAAPRRAAAKRPLADGDEARKARALWVSLYHLGVVQDPSERALEAFLERQSGGRGRGVAKLQWMDGAAALKVIEALKAMAARPVAKGGAGVDWAPYTNPITREVTYDPRRRVVEAQARILGADRTQLDAWCSLVTRQPHLTWCTEAELDRLIEWLGARVRQVRGGSA